MLRCVQVLRRLMVRNKDVGVFCNVSAATLGNPVNFAQCLDFLEANRALAPSFVLEFKQSTFRNLGPTETEHLAALSQRGYRFSIDHVTDLRFEPRELADRGVRFIKVPASLLLDPRQTSTSDIHPSDLSDLLGRFGIDLIAEKIEGERAVVDLLDYDVRFGQGFLFAPPRPLRPEGASATGGATATKAQEPNGSSNAAPSTASDRRPAAAGDRQCRAGAPRRRTRLTGDSRMTSCTLSRGCATSSAASRSCSPTSGAWCITGWNRFPRPARRCTPTASRAAPSSSSPTRRARPIRCSGNCASSASPTRPMTRSSLRAT